MLDKLRTPFFVIAALVMLIAVFAELGSSLLPASFDERMIRTQTDRQLRDSDLDEDERRETIDQMVEEARKSEKPPGVGIAYMALLDGILLYTVVLIGVSLLLPERIHGRVQGVATLIFSILVILAAIGLFIGAFIKLMIMVGLFMSPPFGTLAYLAVWGFFNRGGAAAMLAFLMILKLAFVVLLILAHQRFLQNKGLVLLIVTSLACNFIIAFLHALVPIFLVSITDMIGGLIALILAAVWAILMLISSIVSIVKAIV
ncbi:MAG: hypothetical protein KIT09_25645 [Bryobacteraceae bacterium]|nr:hypothetical protein [Bryobacteraceae bacterium]